MHITQHHATTTLNSHQLPCHENGNLLPNENIVPGPCRISYFWLGSTVFRHYTREDIFCGLDGLKCDFFQADVKSLLEIVYTGSIEATMEEMRRMLILAHSLYISVPVMKNMILLLLNLTTVSKVSDQLMKMLGLTLPPLPSLKQTKSLEPNVAAASISPVVAPPVPLDLVQGFNPSE